MARMTMTVEFDMPEGGDLTDAVLGRMAEQLLEEYRGEIRSDMVTRARAFFEQRMQNNIGLLITDAIEKAIQTTDSYGNVKGDPKTLHEMIMQRADAVLRERRDSRSGYQRGAPLIEEIVSSEIEQAWTRELKDIVKAASDEVRGAVREKAAEVIAETIARTRV